jgi:hypothetical protein
MDRPTLVEVVKDTAPIASGGFIYPFHEMSTPRAELEKKLGYQKDIGPAVQEAKRLMKEPATPAASRTWNSSSVVTSPRSSCGRWPSRRCSRSTSTSSLTYATVQTSVWFDEAAAGNFDLAISAIVSSLMDPSDIFSAWYGKGGPQNYSRWSNAAFYELTPQIEKELDDNKRRVLVRKAEEILENDPPLIPISYEQIYDAYYNKVKGQNPSTFFGIYDVVRWDNVWLAQS